MKITVDKMFFFSPYEAEKKHNGRIVTILGEHRTDGDAENDTIKVEFNDGTKIDALEEELHFSNWMFPNEKIRED